MKKIEESLRFSDNITRVKGLLLRLSIPSLKERLISPKLIQTKVLGVGKIICNIVSS